MPVDKQTARRALEPYVEFGALRDELLQRWDGLFTNQSWQAMSATPRSRKWMRTRVSGG